MKAEALRAACLQDLSPSIVPKRNYLAVDVTVSSVYAVEKYNSIRCLYVPKTIEWE